MCNEPVAFAKRVVYIVGYEHRVRIAARREVGMRLGPVQKWRGFLHSGAYGTPLEVYA